MATEISVHDLSHDTLWDELRSVIEDARRRGHDRCELVFGWHWGMVYPPGEPWKTFIVLLEQVEDEVRIPEEAALGRLGRDDVTIGIPAEGCSFEFCHHSGIHLTVSHPTPIAREFFERWDSAGLGPLQRDCPPSP